MEEARRKHVSLPDRTVRFLEAYQSRHELGSFSATVEAAALALEAVEREALYREFAHDYARDSMEQQEAEAWLGFPMDET